MNAKPCSICGQVKPLSAYYAEKRNDDGLRTDCKKCNKRNAKRRRGPTRYEQAPEWHERLGCKPDWQIVDSKVGIDYASPRSHAYIRAALRACRDDGYMPGAEEWKANGPPDLPITLQHVAKYMVGRESVSELAEWAGLDYARKAYRPKWEAMGEFIETAGEAHRQMLREAADEYAPILKACGRPRVVSAYKPRLGAWVDVVATVIR